MTLSWNRFGRGSLPAAATCFAGCSSVAADAANSRPQPTSTSSSSSSSRRSGTGSSFGISHSIAALPTSSQTPCLRLRRPDRRSVCKRRTANDTRTPIGSSSSERCSIRLGAGLGGRRLRSTASARGRGACHGRYSLLPTIRDLFGYVGSPPAASPRRPPSSCGTLPD
jgi:hypothetical protein